MIEGSVSELHPRPSTTRCYEFLRRFVSEGYDVVRTRRDRVMNTAELIYEQVKALPEPLAQEVLDFMGDLRAKLEHGEVLDLVLCADATRWRQRTTAAGGSASQEPNAEVALVRGGEDGVMPVGERSAAGDHPALGVMADGLELPYAPLPFSPYPFEVPDVFPAIAEHAVDGVVETHEP